MNKLTDANGVVRYSVRSSASGLYQIRCQHLRNKLNKSLAGIGADLFAEDSACLFDGLLLIGCRN